MRNPMVSKYPTEVGCALSIIIPWFQSNCCCFPGISLAIQTVQKFLSMRLAGCNLLKCLEVPMAGWWLQHPCKKYQCHFWSASTLDGWKNTSCWNHQSYYVYIYSFYINIHYNYNTSVYKYVHIYIIIYIYTYIIYKSPPVVPWSSLKTSLKQRHLKAGHLHEVCFGCHRAARRPGWQTPHGSSYWTLPI